MTDGRCEVGDCESGSRGRRLQRPAPATDIRAAPVHTIGEAVKHCQRREHDLMSVTGRTAGSAEAGAILAESEGGGCSSEELERARTQRDNAGDLCLRPRTHPFLEHRTDGVYERSNITGLTNTFASTQLHGGFNFRRTARRTENHDSDIRTIGLRKYF